MPPENDVTFGEHNRIILDSSVGPEALSEARHLIRADPAKSDFVVLGFPECQTAYSISS